MAWEHLSCVVALLCKLVLHAVAGGVYDLCIVLPCRLLMAGFAMVRSITRWVLYRAATLADKAVLQPYSAGCVALHTT
jgi:hypothetical protein